MTVSYTDENNKINYCSLVKSDNSNFTIGKYIDFYASEYSCALFIADLNFDYYFGMIWFIITMSYMLFIFTIVRENYNCYDIFKLFKRKIKCILSFCFCFFCPNTRYRNLGLMGLIHDALPYAIFRRALTVTFTRNNRLRVDEFDT